MGAKIEIGIAPFECGFLGICPPSQPFARLQDLHGQTHFLAIPRGHQSGDAAANDDDVKCFFRRFVSHDFTSLRGMIAKIAAVLKKDRKLISEDQDDCFQKQLDKLFGGITC